MGTVQSVDWLRDYTEVYHESQQIECRDTRRLLRHFLSGECFELMTIPILSEAHRQTLANQIKTRSEKRNSALVSLVKAVYQKQSNLCSKSERYDILFKQIAPTMLNELHLRRNRQETFSDDEILLTINRVAAGLKECEQMKEDHGSISLQNISIRQNLYLRDPLTIQKESQTQIQLTVFPCPLRLRASYDCIDFKQLPSDLFSLGMVALQLSYPQMDVQRLYIRPLHLYLNIKFDWKQANSLLNLIKGNKLQRAVRILLDQNPKKRLQIYDYMQDIVISKDLHLLEAMYFKRKKEDELVQSIKTYTNSIVQQKTTSRNAQKPATNTTEQLNRPVSRVNTLRSSYTFGKLHL